MNTTTYVRLFTACMKHRMCSRLMDFWWLLLFLFNNKYSTWITRLRKSICGLLLCTMALVNMWLSSCYLTDKHAPNTGTLYSNYLYWLSIWINIILSVLTFLFLWLNKYYIEFILSILYINEHQFLTLFLWTHFLKIYFYVSLCVYVWAYTMCVRAHREARRGQWVPSSWNYQPL